MIDDTGNDGAVAVCEYCGDPIDPRESSKGFCPECWAWAELLDCEGTLESFMAAKKSSGIEVDRDGCKLMLVPSIGVDAGRPYVDAVLIDPKRSIVVRARWSTAHLSKADAREALDFFIEHDRSADEWFKWCKSYRGDSAKFAISTLKEGELNVRRGDWFLAASSYVSAADGPYVSMHAFGPAGMTVRLRRRQSEKLTESDASKALDQVISLFEDPDVKLKLGGSGQFEVEW